MKRPITLTIILFSFIIHSYSQLSIQYNRLRIGDEIIKQQVEYKDPGQAGANRLWDFSQLETINQEYSLLYSAAPLVDDSIYVLGDYRFKKTSVGDDELFVGTEHNTMYYYRLSGDSLLLLGHETPYVKLMYEEPVLTMVFPVNFAKRGSDADYLSKGLYAGSIPMQTKGSISVYADAYGKMIMPAGDTINPVLRVKTVQTIQESDSLPIKIQESYKWYTKGYRYPLFETVRNMESDSTQIFATAFYYPAQDHFYLDTDPDNLALLDELWDMDDENKQDTNIPEPEIESNPLAEYISYKIYPNPVSTLLTLEYTIKKESAVSFDLYSFDGNIVRKVNKKNYKEGDYVESFTMSGLMPGNYILRITANNQFVNEKIIKK